MPSQNSTRHPSSRGDVRSLVTISAVVVVPHVRSLRRRSTGPERGRTAAHGRHHHHAGADRDRRYVGLHRHAALAALDDDSAGGGRAGHAHLREGGPARQRRHAARADQPGQAAGRRVELGGQSRGHRGRRPGTGASRPSAWSRWSRPVRSAGPRSIRRRTRSARPRRVSPPSKRRCARDASNSSSTASRRPRQARSGTSRSASATG